MQSTLTSSPADDVSRTEQILNAKERLPAPLRKIFDALFLDGCSDDEAARRLDLSQEALAEGRHTVLRTLMGVV